MSDSEKREKKSRKEPAKNKTMDWVIRGAIFGVLGILLILALLDYSAKQNAQGTADAWRAALKSKGEFSDMFKSEFDKVAVKGSPTITTSQSAVRSVSANSVTTYVWKGPFRTYAVKVSFGLGNDPSVESVDGPGDMQP